MVDNLAVKNNISVMEQEIKILITGKMQEHDEKIASLESKSAF